MDIKCRACLATTEAKMYHSLISIFPEYMKTSLRVLDLLEFVTSTSVAMSYRLPDSICTACLKLLRDCYTFIKQFKEAESWLQDNYCQEAEAKSETITIKTINEKFSSPVLLDLKENDVNGVFQTVNSQVIQNNRNEGTTNQKRRERKPGKKKSCIRPIKKTTDGIIVMSVEDVQSEEAVKPVLSEYFLNTTEKRNNDLVQNEKNIRNDHTYQKNCEESSQPNSKLFIMSIEDVVKTTTRSIVRRSSRIERNRVKSMITQATDLVKNKTRKRITRNQTVEGNEDTNLICDVCHKIYDSQKKMIAHKIRIHQSEWHEKYKCSFCNVHCRTLSAFIHHKSRHENKKYNCDCCDKVFLTNSEVKQHKMRVHNGMPPKFLCTECGKRFKFSTGLKYHVISMHQPDEKPYICRYCGFRCVQQSYMKRHERCHTNERPYKCEFCDKTFRGVAEQRSHQLVHKGKYRYFCQFCGKGFITTWNMKVHCLQHGGDYHCRMCKKQFIDETVLNFHYLYHHKIRGDDKEACENISSNEEN